LIRLLHTQQALSDRFIAYVLARSTRLESDLSAQLLNSSEQRLARTLLVLAGCDERRPCRCALPDVSQEVIAEMVGTTRSRVNVFIGKFKRLGFIEEDGGVLQINPSLFPVVREGQRSPHESDPGAMPRGTAAVASVVFRHGLEWHRGDSHVDPTPLQSPQVLHD
jgi:hypothetical protein